MPLLFQWFCLFFSPFYWDKTQGLGHARQLLCHWTGPLGPGFCIVHAASTCLDITMIKCCGSQEPWTTTQLYYRLCELRPQIMFSFCQRLPYFPKSLCEVPMGLSAPSMCRWITQDSTRHTVTHNLSNVACYVLRLWVISGLTIYAR